MKGATAPDPDHAPHQQTHGPTLRLRRQHEDRRDDRGHTNRDRDGEGKQLTDRGTHAYQLISDNSGSQPAATKHSPLGPRDADGSVDVLGSVA